MQRQLIYASPGGVREAERRGGCLTAAAAIVWRRRRRAITGGKFSWLEIH